jgi:hypothetical protein
MIYSIPYYIFGVISKIKLPYLLTLSVVFITSFFGSVQSKAIGILFVIITLETHSKNIPFSHIEYLLSIKKSPLYGLIFSFISNFLIFVPFVICFGIFGVSLASFVVIYLTQRLLFGLKPVYLIPNILISGLIIYQILKLKHLILIDTTLLILSILYYSLMHRFAVSRYEKIVL